jgi:hypothetical protein
MPDYHFDPQCCAWDEDGNPEGCYGGEPEPPGCGECNDSGAVWARVFASRGRVRRCPSCNPGWLRRLPADLRWWWWRKRHPAPVSSEAPF